MVQAPGTIVEQLTKRMASQLIQGIGGQAKRLIMSTIDKMCGQTGNGPDGYCGKEQFCPHSFNSDDNYCTAMLPCVRRGFVCPACAIVLSSLARVVSHHATPSANMMMDQPLR